MLFVFIICAALKLHLRPSKLKKIETSKTKSCKYSNHVRNSSNIRSLVKRPSLLPAGIAFSIRSLLCRAAILDSWLEKPRICSICEHLLSKNSVLRMYNNMNDTGRSILSCTPFFLSLSLFLFSPLLQFLLSVARTIHQQAISLSFFLHYRAPK